MADTLSSMRTAIRNRLGVPSTDNFYTDAVLTEFINEAIQAIAAEDDWPWLTTETTHALTQVTPTAPDSADISPPANWSRTKSLVVFGFEPLVLIPLQDANQIITQGRPLQYTIIKDKIRPRPFPDGSYTLTHTYIRTEPTLANDADEPLMPDQFRKSIIDYATFLAHERSSLEPERVREALQRYNMWLVRMRSHRRRVTAPLKPRVRPGGWL